MNQKTFFGIVVIVLFLTQITMVAFSLYYIPLVIIIGFYFWLYAGFKVDTLTLLFLIATLMSILLNDIPSFFHPWSRFALFIILMFSVSPLNKSESVTIYRESLLMNCCVVASGIMLLNLVSYYGGFGQTTFIGFWGVCYHANLLGVFSMIGIIYMLALYLEEEKVTRKYFYLLCMTGGVVVLLLASSRNCLACAVIGCALYLKLYFKSNSIYITIIICLAIMYVFIAPFFEEFTFGLTKKMSDATNLTSITGSRDAIWATRFEEFRKSPIFGIGAFSVDTSIQTDGVYFNPYNPITGTVELGSTYLGVLSQTGLFGFIIFIVILAKSLRKGYKIAVEDHSRNQLLVFILLVMFTFHMIFEGYVNTAGQFLTFFLWLVIACNLQPSGQIDNLDNHNNIIYY